MKPWMMLLFDQQDTLAAPGQQRRGRGAGGSAADHKYIEFFVTRDRHDRNLQHALNGDNQIFMAQVVTRRQHDPSVGQVAYQMGSPRINCLAVKDAPGSE